MIIRKTLKIDPNNQSVSSQSLLCAAALRAFTSKMIFNWTCRWSGLTWMIICITWLIYASFRLSIFVFLCLIANENHFKFQIFHFSSVVPPSTLNNLNLQNLNLKLKSGGKKYKVAENVKTQMCSTWVNSSKLHSIISFSKCWQRFGFLMQIKKNIDHLLGY